MIEASNLAINLLVSVIEVIPASPLMYVFGVFIVASAIGLIKSIIFIR